MFHAICVFLWIWFAWAAFVECVRRFNREAREARERVEHMVQRRYELAAQARLAPERYYWWD